jgi:hypothetical protein
VCAGRQGDPRRVPGPDGRSPRVSGDHRATQALVAAVCEGTYQIRVNRKRRAYVTCPMKPPPARAVLSAPGRDAVRYGARQCNVALDGRQSFAALTRSGSGRRESPTRLSLSPGLRSRLTLKSHHRTHAFEDPQTALLEFLPDPQGQGAFRGTQRGFDWAANGSRRHGCSLRRPDRRRVTERRRCRSRG